MTDVDPAVDRGDEVLQPLQGLALRLGLRGQQGAALDRAPQLLRIVRIEPAREILERVCVDRDSLRELGDLAHHVQVQPARVPVQSRVGELAGGQVEGDLVLRDLQALAERGQILRDHRGGAGGEHRDAHVATGDHLKREVAEHLAELHREHRAADAPHEAPGALHHAAHVLRRVTLERGHQSVRDARGHGGRDLLPHRKGLLHPLAAGECARRGCELGDRGRLADPQIREGERVRDRGARAGADAETVAVRDVQSLAQGGLPRVPVHGVLHLLHQLLHHRGVELQALHALQRAQIHALRVLAEHAAQELQEVLGVRVVLCHRQSLSARV